MTKKERMKCKRQVTVLGTRVWQYWFFQIPLHSLTSIVLMDSPRSQVVAHEQLFGISHNCFLLELCKGYACTGLQRQPLKPSMLLSIVPCECRRTAFNSFTFRFSYATNSTTPPDSLIFLSASLLKYLALITIGISGILPLPRTLL